jgi:hypothetical protein
LKKGAQTAICCPCGNEKILALGLCATCYTLKRQDAEYFGGLREQVLERDGYACRVCGDPDPGVHHREPGKSLLHLMIALCGAALYGLRERNSMARVRDVAAYIISKLRSVDVMKLQKLLLYYSQAWSLVVRKVFKTYQGQYKVSRALEGYKTSLTEDERGTVDAILRFNGDKEGFYLSELTHAVKD